MVVISHSCFAQEERVIVSLYYPSSYGSYDELQAVRMAVGQNAWMPGSAGPPGPYDPSADSGNTVLSWGTARGGLKASTDGTVQGIELGGPGATPYIDFSDDVAPGNDYDVRMWLNPSGNLEIIANEIRGINNCMRMSYTTDLNTSYVVRCKDINGGNNNYQIAGQNYGGAPRTGYILCCEFDRNYSDNFY